MEKIALEAQTNIYKDFLLQEPEEIRDLFLLEICDKLSLYFGDVIDPINYMEIGISLWRSLPVENVAATEFALIFKKRYDMLGTDIPPKIENFYKSLNIGNSMQLFNQMRPFSTSTSTGILQ